MSSQPNHTFVCPACAVSLTVDAARKAALENNGCSLCGADVPPSAFGAP